MTKQWPSELKKVGTVNGHFYFSRRATCILGATGELKMLIVATVSDVLYNLTPKSLVTNHPNYLMKDGEQKMLK